MASRATGGTFAAFLISGAILGFAGGALLGTNADAEGSGGGGTPTSSATAPADGSAGADATDGASPDPTESAGDGALTISAQQDQVQADGRIDLSGVIDPPEEGVKVQLQRSVDGGEFEDFPIDPWDTNANGEFSGYVKSSRTGENQFRVVLVDDPEVASEPATVQVG